MKGRRKGDSNWEGSEFQTIGRYWKGFITHIRIVPNRFGTPNRIEPITPIFYYIFTLRLSGRVHELRVEMCRAEPCILPFNGKIYAFLLSCMDTRFQCVMITSIGTLSTPGTTTSRHNASQKRGVPERSVWIAPKIAIATGNTINKRTSGQNFPRQGYSPLILPAILGTSFPILPPKFPWHTRFPSLTLQLSKRKSLSISIEAQKW